MKRTLAIMSALLIGLAMIQAGVPAGAEPAAAGAGELVHGWKIQSSAVAKDSGAKVSRPGYSTAGWLPISQPETLMAGLLENGQFPDIFRSTNLARVPTDQFKVNWWYRNEFSL